MAIHDSWICDDDVKEEQEDWVHVTKRDKTNPSEDDKPKPSDDAKPNPSGDVEAKPSKVDDLFVYGKDDFKVDPKVNVIDFTKMKPRPLFCLYCKRDTNHDIFQCPDMDFKKIGYCQLCDEIGHRGEECRYLQANFYLGDK